jgi:hypothetical protein
VLQGREWYGNRIACSTASRLPGSAGERNFLFESIR